MKVPSLIGLAGIAGVGKDTLAGFIQSEYGHRIRAYADPLRALLNARFGWQPQQWTNRGWKENAHWANECGNFSPRSWMQWLGTDVLRRYAGEDIFVRLAFEDWDQAPFPMVLSDIRFNNEAKAITDRGGFVIMLHRPDAMPVEPHVSERSLPQVQAHLWNISTIPQLFESARAMLEHEVTQRTQLSFDFQAAAR